MRKIEFKIGKQEYVVKDVNLMNYKDVMEMLQNPDGETPFEIVEFLSGCPKEDLKALKYSDWYFLWQEVQDLLTGNYTTQSILPIIEFAGIKYGLPQIEDMSVGEFADLDIIASGTNPENRLAEVAAILYRPVIEETDTYIKLEKYTVEGAKKREKLFQYLPLSAIKSANAFFLQSASRSLENMLGYLQNQNQTSTFPQDLEDLEKSLPPDLGGYSLMSLLEKIPSDLTLLQNSLYGPPSTGLLGRETKLNDKN